MSNIQKYCALFTTLAPVFNSIIVLFFFRNIQFTTGISLALYVGLLHFAALTGHIQPASTFPDAGFPYDGLAGWATNQPFWSAVSAAVLVFLQALIVNGMADSFRLMNDRNWLPGLGYALAASALPDFQFLSPPLIAATFVALAVRTVFLTYKSPKSAVLVFDAAFFIGVSSLFYPKALFLIIALYFSIGVMRSWNFRDQMAFFTGIFVPIWLGWLWYFWNDVGGAFRSRHFGELFGFSKFDVAIDLAFLLKGGLLFFFLLLFLANYGAFSRNKSMQGQKCVEVLYWVLLVGGVIAFLRPVWQWETYVLTVAPAGIFLAMGLQGMRQLYAEGLHLALLLYILFLQYFQL